MQDGCKTDFRDFSTSTLTSVQSAAGEGTSADCSSKYHVSIACIIPSKRPCASCHKNALKDGCRSVSFEWMDFMGLGMDISRWGEV